MKELESVNELFSITDPLYEFGVFKTRKKQSIFEFWFGESQPPEKLISRLVTTFEINRLNYLKQSGLLFLIFPSATHTRFAHSIGTMNLGLYAIERIKVRHYKGEEDLEEFLLRENILEEFFVALLIHDIGHFPFSHTLEYSLKITSEYKDHENVTQSFIDKGSELYKRLKEEADKKSLPTIVEVCEDYKNIDLSKVRSLLDSSSKTPIKYLISGHIDLDRLDHYYRDSFFMGLKLAAVNISGFLNSIVIEIEPESRILLREEGIPHVLHLLFAKEMLWQRALDNDFNYAYQAMLVYAVEKWLEKKPEKLKDIPFMTEEILLSELSEVDECKKMIDRIFSRRPYHIIYKGETTLSENSIRTIFEEWKMKNSANEEDFLLFLPRNFQKKDAIFKEWGIFLLFLIQVKHAPLMIFMVT